MSRLVACTFVSVGRGSSYEGWVDSFWVNALSFIGPKGGVRDHEYVSNTEDTPRISSVNPTGVHGRGVNRGNGRGGRTGHSIGHSDGYELSPRRSEPGSARRAAAGLTARQPPGPGHASAALTPPGGPGDRPPSPRLRGPGPGGCVTPRRDRRVTVPRRYAALHRHTAVSHDLATVKRDETVT
eukprot:765616-Hanusia_phi.AAC.1